MTKESAAMRTAMALVCICLLCVGSVWAEDGAQPQPGAAVKAGAVAKPPAAKKPAAAKEWTVESNIAYVKDGHKAQVLDLYLPENKEGKALPVVLWIHGGGWKMGSKSGGPFPFLLKQGYAVVSVEYRFSQVVKFPAQIQDCQAALRWVRANADKYKLDGTRVGVWGASAGGHLAALMGTAGGKGVFAPIGEHGGQSDKVSAVVDFFGPANFNTLREQARTDPKSVRAKEASGDNASLLLGVNVEEDKEKAAAGSPIHYVSKDSPAFLIFHGDADHTVPFAQSVEFDEALKKAGVESIFQRLPGSGHGGRMFASPEAEKLILAFLDKHLKGKELKVEAMDPEELREKKKEVKVVAPAVGGQEE